MALRIYKSRRKRFAPPSRTEPAAQPKTARSTATGLLIGFLLWAVALALVFISGLKPFSSLTVGQRSPLTVVAAVDFSCRDVAKTELNRQQTANEIPPVFSIDYRMLNTASRSLDKLFGRLAQIRQPAAVPQDIAGQDREIGDVLDLLGLPIAATQARQLAPAGQEDQVLESLKSSLRDTWATGIISPQEKKSRYQGTALANRIALRDAEGSLHGPVRLDSLLLPEAALDAVAKSVLAQNPSIPKNALTALLQPWIVPNLVYDPHETAVRKSAAEEAVETVEMKVRAGTTLVEAGERVTPQILEQLGAHEERRGRLESAADRAVKRIGTAGLLFAALIACVGLLQILRPDLTRRANPILLLATLSLLALVPAKGFMILSSNTSPIPPAVLEFALPLALAPLLASILVGREAAVTLGLWNSFAMAVMFDHHFTVFALGLVVTVVAVLSTLDVRRRSRLYRAGFFVGLAEMLYAISIAAIDQQTAAVVSSQALTGLANGLLCALLASLLIPLFEFLFGVTTNLTLLELSDMGNPLLQRLAMEAPGTYHHSIVTANLGQAAAARIGANALLVRVCAYFHDVGKLAKPEFFTENMRLRDNPHDDLTPSMSTLVITSHVKEGVGLARRHRLPRCVIDGIQQHHGTSLVSFFFHRARQEQEEAETNGGPRANGRSVNEGDFRYEGPKPQTREMAILSLADSVEAAARSIEKPAPGRLEGLVHEVVDAKLLDGQLDECNLTLRELAAIKRSFVFSLANMLHVRIAYPQNETPSAQPAGRTTPAVGADPEAGSLALGTGGPAVGRSDAGPDR